jgi:alkylated DNA repair dioxygenase AlkB
MTKLIEFEDIPGLYFIPNVFTQKENDIYMNILNTDQGNYCPQIHKATEYGWKFLPPNDENLNVIPRNEQDYLGQFPDWLNDIWEKINACIQNILSDKDFKPDHALINKYDIGDGCHSHVDDLKFWTDWVICVSFGSGAMLEFSNNLNCTEIYAHPQSIYIMTDVARNVWNHAVKFDKIDTVYGDEISRTKRISISFRALSEEALSDQVREVVKNKN